MPNEYFNRIHNGAQEAIKAFSSGQNERPMTHIYVWGNNPKRAKLKGKKCRILVSSGRRFNGCLIEFEGGEQVNTSRRALRKID